jgi:hypothetical protein
LINIALGKSFRNAVDYGNILIKSGLLCEDPGGEMKD